MRQRTRRSLTPALLACCLLATQPTRSARAQAVALGPDTQVNTYETSAQGLPDVAASTDGSFTVVFQSFGSDGDNSNFSIRGRRFSSSGSPLGSGFQVNTYTQGAQRIPATARGADGRFVVVWQSDSDNDGGTNYSIRMRRFSSDGSAIGSEVQVDSLSTASQTEPDVAMTPDGRFVVAWNVPSLGSDGDGGIALRRYSSSGQALGSEVLANHYTTGSQSTPAVAIDDEGDFVVVWESGYGAGSESDGSVQARRFTSAGGAAGAQIQVNTFTPDSQDTPVVAMAPSGDFAVAWRSDGSTGSDQDELSIQGRVFAANGSPLSPQFQANVYTTGRQHVPAIAAGPGGDFVIAWHSRYSNLGDLDYGIVGRLFDAGGNAISGEFRINSHTTGTQANSQVATDRRGDFVVTWRSDTGPPGDDNDNSATRARRFSGLASAEIFTDGFESGDTSAWSVSVP